MPDHPDPSRTIDVPADQVSSVASSRDETQVTSSDGSGASGTGFSSPAVAGELGTLGPYRVVKQLGMGGMGAVYLAVDTRLNRKLALKVMLPEFAANPDAKERFLREARAAALVAHDNVVTIFEADERGGVPYIAMQYLQGYPLDEYLKAKGLPSLPHAVRIARETALGLAAAHARGLVHRDIKPANLWLESPNGRVKVLDFGLARPVTSDAELTKSGTVVGTPAFMSPEQAGGEKVDHRTDLFSLGGVLYKLCTGKNPFPGQGTMAVLMALGTREPEPVRALNPAVPESLAALIGELLAKKPGGRPPSAAEVAKRLRAIQEQLLAPPVPMATAAEVSTSQPVVVHPLPIQPLIVSPMDITAQPESAFANLDADERTDEQAHGDSESTAPKPQRRTPRSAGWGTWVAAGAGLLLVAGMVAGVIIIIKNKDGTETKIEVPDGATVTVKNKDGKTVAQVPAEGKTPAATDPDRKAAEYVLSIGGELTVDRNDLAVKRVGELPGGGFRLTNVVLLGNNQVTDAGLAALNGCESLDQLDLCLTQVSDAGLLHLKGRKSLKIIGLYRTKTTDAGLAYLKDCAGLTYLNVQECAGVTDAGLVHIKGFRNLDNLNLASTGVTDAGVAHIKDCKALGALYLDWTAVTDTGLAQLAGLDKLTLLQVPKTQVTAKGVEALAKALPKCKIVWDGGTIEPAMKENPDRKAAEYVLSIGGTVSLIGGDSEVGATDKLPATAFHLEAIKLTANDKVTDAGLAALKGCAAVRTLDLAGAPISDAGLAHLKDCHGLEDINLHATAITDAGLGHIKACKNLAVLNVDRCGKVTDAGLLHCREFKKLTKLHLGETRVTDDGLAHLKGCQNLTALFLTGSKVTDASLRHLTAIKTLTELNLTRTGVTKEGVEKLAKELPNCKVEWDGGTIEPKK